VRWLVAALLAVTGGTQAHPHWINPDDLWRDRLATLADQGAWLAAWCPHSQGSRIGEFPPPWGLPHDWRSSRHSRLGTGIDSEQLPEAGTELAVEDGALKQEIGPASGLSHLLRFVHAAGDQEVGRCFGQRCADPQTGTMALGVVDQPTCCLF
jgi:hypothetical protein